MREAFEETGLTSLVMWRSLGEREIDIASFGRDEIHHRHFFPETIKEKDINDMILNGIDQSGIVKIINKNTYKGVGANLKLLKWRKIK